MRLSRLRVGFQIVLHLVLIGHVVSYYWLDWRQVGALDFQSFFHHFIGEGVLTAGALLTLAVYGSALVFGRLFCSWGCHFGATQDLAAWVLRRFGWRPPLVQTRFLHWFPYFFLVVIFFLPLLERRSDSDWTLSFDLAAVAPWDTLPGWLLSVITFLACGAAILLFLGTRGFCRFVCPYGALFRLTDKVTPFRVRRVAPCAGACAPAGPAPAAVPPCTAACPTAIDVHRETLETGAVRSSDCVRCNLCIEACPQQALAYRSRPAAGIADAAPDEQRAGPRRTAPETTLSAAGEMLVAGAALVTYLLIDLVYGGHFLAASAALGEGFLVYAALKEWRRVRAAKSWTFAAVTTVGALALTLVPLFEAGAFKLLRYKGLQLDSGALEELPAAWSETTVGVVEEPRARRDLERAADCYRRALEYFPRHPETLRLLLSAYVRLHDRRALEVAERLWRVGESSDAGRELFYWVCVRFGELERARTLEADSRLNARPDR